MDDLLLMQVLASIYQLTNVALSFQLRQTLSPPHQFIQALVSAYFEHNVDTLFVFEELLKADNLLIVEGLVDLDLACQLQRLFFKGSPSA